MTSILFLVYPVFVSYLPFTGRLWCRLWM